MPQKLVLAVSQSRTLDSLGATLEALAATTRTAAAQGVDLVLFPEAYLGGYPRGCTFGSAVGSREAAGREQYLRYYHAAVDLGDTPGGAGEAWVQRQLPLPADGSREQRGDGTREFVERVARETGVFVVTGVVERSGGTLYCSVVYVCPRRGCIGKRRKVMPTASERLVWGQGQPDTLRAVTTTIKGVRLTMAAAICWENLMPLLRYALYSQNVNLWLAPTADARDTWLPLMRTVANEGRCAVLSAISCVRRKNLPPWIAGPPPEASKDREGGIAASLATTTAPRSPSRPRRMSMTVPLPGEKHQLVLPAMDEDGAQGLDHVEAGDVLSKVASSPPAVANGVGGDRQGEDFACRGGSCIIGPTTQVLAGPLWEVEDGGLLVQEVDFEDCERGRLDLDVAGSYSRNDAFKLTVQGLDITPPP